MSDDLGNGASLRDRAVASGAASVSALRASVPSALLLTEADCDFLIAIPRTLRRERGWSGARSVGMGKLIEERLHTFIARKLWQQMEPKDD